MKTLLHFLLLISSLAVYAQTESGLPKDPATGHVVYKEVVTAAGSPEELYKRIDHWFNTYFKSPAQVINKKYETTKTMAGTHRFTIYNTANGQKIQKGNVFYTVSVEAKEGRYRYVIDEIYFFQSPKLYIEKWEDKTDKMYATHQQYLAQVTQYLTELINNLKDTLSKPVPAKGSDEW